MSSRSEALVFACHADDVAVLKQVSGTRGPVLVIVDSLVEVAHLAATRRPIAVFLGVGRSTLAHLEVIRTIRAVRSELPVVVVAAEDSLDLERRARQETIFYYLVHPIDRPEVEAVLKAILRHVG